MTEPFSFKKLLNKKNNKKKKKYRKYLADLGEASGSSTNTFVIKSVSHPFSPTALQRRHAQTVRDSPSSYKIDYVILIKNFLNSEGYQNCISRSKVTAIWRDGLFLLVELQRNIKLNYSNVWNLYYLTNVMCQSSNE